MNIKSGDLLLFRAEKGISKIIAYGTNSIYSHISIIVSPSMNLMIEASSGGGVRASDIRRIDRRYDVFRVKKQYKYDLDAVISFLISKLSSKYDYAGVFYLVF